MAGRSRPIFVDARILDAAERVAESHSVSRGFVIRVVLLRAFRLTEEAVREGNSLERIEPGCASTIRWVTSPGLAGRACLRWRSRGTQSREAFGGPGV